MKIRAISVYGLFNEFDYELNLNPDLTFIHSPNGYGKSTIMHMVSSVLKGDCSYLEDVPFTRLDISFEDDSVLVIEKNQEGCRYSVVKNKLTSPITADELENFSDIVYISPERMVVRRKDGHIVDAMEAVAQELNDTVRLAKDDSELVPVSKEGRRDMSDSELEFWCKDLKAKLDFIKDAGFEPSMPSGMRFPPSRYDLIDSRERYEDLAYSISDYVDREYNLAESIIVFKDIVNNIYINKTIDVRDNGKLTVSMNNGTALPLSKLSSGEKQILLMFYTILFHSQNGSVVIIDEPEISLHVLWQQSLGDYLNDISRVRNVQMVIATHSPQVIHDRWDNAKELVLKNA
jgi:predicted ATP-binding protein involved in virulence